MPRQNIGFMLEPHGFFNQNPTLNLPTETRTTNGGHCSTANGH
jgi:primary-amine oxidase